MQDSNISKKDYAFTKEELNICNKLNKTIERQLIERKLKRLKDN